MPRPRLLIAFLCPPLHHAKAGPDDPLAILDTLGIGFLWLVPGVGLIFVGIRGFWRSQLLPGAGTGFALAFGALFWALAAVWAYRSRWARRWMIVNLLVVSLVFVVSTQYADIQPKARLGADEGIVAAMTSAVAIYYFKHDGTFPAHPGHYVSPPPVFQCDADQFDYSYDVSTGLFRVTRAEGGCTTLEERRRSFLWPIGLAAVLLMIQLVAAGGFVSQGVRSRSDT
jgi:4-amino-4-deoxy-L-arabinose transferase-like glycosyltransferase